MKVKCINKIGLSLRSFEIEQSLEKEIKGRFEATGYKEYNELEIGQEYFVMGIIILNSYQGYLIDSDGFISVCPTPLFDIVDNKIPVQWKFRQINKNENIYPFIQGIFGYHELCEDFLAYENLIVEKNEEHENIYFKRKIQIYGEI